MVQTPVEPLLSVVYQYYPRGLQPYDPRYQSSPEHLRLRALRAEAGQGERRAAWDALVERLADRLPGRSVVDWTHLAPQNHDACYRVRINLAPQAPQFVHYLVGLVSALVPFHAVYASSGVTGQRKGPLATRFTFTPEEQPALDILTGEIESTFGYSRLPHEIGNTLVPDAAGSTKPLGRNTLYDLLFTDDLW